MNNTVQQIRASLFSMQDTKYREFQRKLLPTVNPDRIIGVRMPDLRRYAKQLAKADNTAFLRELPHRYYEENNLHAALLEQIRDDQTALTEIERFLPYLDNWSTCDSFCPKSLFSKPDQLLLHIRDWLTRNHAYTVRYGLVRLLFWYLDDQHFSTDILELAASVSCEDYYVHMAQAWLFSVALVKQYDATLPYLIQARLPHWVHNKAIQKAVESYRVPKETKIYLKTLKRSRGIEA